MLHTDASNIALGATLSQLDDEGHLRLIGCRSRKLLPAETRYQSNEKEALALVDALKAWRHYLLGAVVNVHTDNSVVSYMQKHPKPNYRHLRWLEVLQDNQLRISPARKTRQLMLYLV